MKMGQDVCKESVRLEQADGLAHGRLDVEGLDVLPVLLQQGDEEVDGQHDVGEELVVGHLDVADGNTQAEHLLKLELDGALDLGDLLLEVLGVGDGGGELAGLGETWAKETGDLLDQSVGRQESVVLLGELRSSKMSVSIMRPTAPTGP